MRIMPVNQQKNKQTFQGKEEGLLPIERALGAALSLDNAFSKHSGIVTVTPPEEFVRMQREIMAEAMANRLKNPPNLLIKIRG